MAGISSEAAKGTDYPTNKKKYNGIEETRDLGLNQYDAPLRVLDPQIAVWWQVDPETENMEMWSPYTSNYDNPILYKDPLGNEPECCWEEFKSALVQTVQQVSSLAAGVANAWGSNQVLGAGRKTANQAGMTGDNATFYSAGQTVGDGLALFTGGLEVIAGGSGEIASVGIASPIAIPLAAHGVSVFATAGYNLFSTPLQGTPPAGGSPSKSVSRESEKLSKVEKSKKVEKIGDKFTKTTEVKPGKGPGQSRAEYIRYKNSQGKTIKNVKDSYDRANKFQHRKPKPLPK